ncbi:hypothetical protein FRB91_003810 [Serendipita sp. 411]|nr:hypothetical protein FRB91_003810 [Serendipita sp. 411]
MSTSATAPSSDGSAFMLFGLDSRLVPVISALIAFFIFAILLMTMLCICHMRRQAALLRDPEYIAALREVELLRIRKEQPQWTTTPILQMLFIDPTQSKGKEKLIWKDIVPVSVETDGPQAKEKATTQSPRTTSRSNTTEPEDVRLVTIIVLPSQAEKNAQSINGLEAAFGVIERRVIK